MNEFELLILMSALCFVVLLIAIGMALCSNYIYKRDLERFNKETYGKRTETKEAEKTEET